MIQINPLKSYIDGGVRAALTTPPSASLVFDLPGKAIWVKGVKLKGTDHTYTFSHDNYITLTNTPDSNESEDIKIGVNTSALKSAIDTTYGVVSTTANGLAPKFTSGNKLAASTATTYYFLGWAGSTLKWYQAPFRNIRINSETTDCLGVNNTDPLIISSGNGISVTWDSTNKKIIITNTKPDVNHNTDTKVALSVTTLNKNYAVILKGNDSDEGSITTVNFSTYLKFNPSTKLLIINGNKVITTIDTFIGATTSVDGSVGLVTKPLIANRLLFLRGDGTWATPTNTWRPVKVEGTEKLGSNALDLSAGNGISIVYNSDTKKIIITNTKPDVNHNTHYTTMLYIGENNDTKANKNVANPYLKLFDDNVRRATFQIKAGSGIAVASDINGNITITNSSPDVNHNTDYRVTQSETTTANYRPLVVGYTNVSTAGSGMAGSVTNQVYLSNKFYVQPSTGNLYATNFVGALSGNASSATKLQTSRNLWGNSFNGTANISGTIIFNNVTSGLCEGILWTCGDNDFARIKAGATGSNAGYLEIATADDGNEPIYVRQYTGVFSTLKRTLTLLNGNGNTILPGSATAIGFNKSGSSNSYVLLGGGGHKLISDFATSNHNHNYLRGHRLGYRHLDAGPKSSWSDSRLYIGYNGFDDDDGVTNSIGFYRSTGTSTYTRTLWAEINSNGLWANNRFGVNGQNTGYTFYVNGSSLLNNVVRIQYNTPNLYIRNTIDTSYSIIRFGTNSNENASYIFQNGPSRTDDGGANTMTIRNNVGYLRLDNSTSITGLLTVSSGSTHKGIKVGNNYINAINGELIILNNTAIRFGNDSWDYNVWAGLKYDSSSKTIYIGLADGTIFSANSALSGGTLRFPGISIVYAPTFNGNLSGNASTATKLTSSAGNAALPIYFSDGKPVACTASSVFSNLSNSGNNISVTVAGQNRTLTVGYAGNSNTVDGYHQGNAVHYVWTNTYTQPTSGATWYLKIKTTDWKNTSDWIWVSCEGDNAHDEYVINTGSRSTTWWAYGVQYTHQLISGCTKIISNSCDTYIRLTSRCTSVRLYATFTPASVTNDSASSYTTIVPGLNAPTFYGNATSATNSDTCDGLHVHGGRNNEANKIVRTDGNGYLQVGYINSSSGNEGNNSSPARVWGTNGSDNYMRTYLTSALSVNYASSAGNADTVDGYHATTGRTFNGNINWSGNWNDAWSDGTHTHPWYGFDHRYSNTGAYSTTISDFFGMTIKTANTLRLDFGTLLLNGTNIYNINVASATKLLTTRTIWGQSFNGTANVDNTLRIRLTTGNYCEGIRIQTGDGAWSTIILGATSDTGTNTNAWSIHRKADNNFAISRNSSDGVNGLVMTSTGMGLGTTAPTHRLDVRGDTKITGSIRDLAIGGGIYWNPYVESASDGSDAASITLVRLGVAGGTTLVLSLMNDSNDTILFKTSTAARLYHNSYPILTTLNTYVSNNKGYINGVEITLVNNASSASTATKLASSGYANNALSYYQTNQAFDGSATGWAHYIIANHGDGSSYYHYTIRLPFLSVPQYRRLTGNTSNVTSWYNFITAENIGSQSVNYATSAGNADTTDGLHLYTRSLGINGTSWTFASTANANSTTNIYAATSAGTSGQILKSTGGTPTWINQSDISAGYATYLNVQYCRDDDLPSNKGLWNTIKNGTTNAITNRVRFYTIYGTTTALGAPTDGFGELLEICSYNTNHWQPLLWFGSGKNGRLYYRNKNYNDNTWGSWRTVAWTSEIPTVTNYYWANVKISASSSTSTSPTFSTCYTSNWFRSTGLTGWYNETYSGGWYMNDTTWIRTWNSKGIYTNTGAIYNLGHAYFACNSGYNVGIGTSAPSYKLHVVGDIYTTTGFKKNGSSDSYVLLGGGGHKAISDFSMSHSHPYLPLAGGTMTGQIQRAGQGSSWIKGRDNAMIRVNSVNGYSVLSSIKTTNGSWEIGHYSADSHKNNLLFGYYPDSNYTAGTNSGCTKVTFTSGGQITAAAFNGALNGNAATASAVKDVTNGRNTYLNYAASGVTSPSWLCAWNTRSDGTYEIRAISPANMLSVIKALPLSGGTLTGDIHISHATTGNPNKGSTNPKIIFSENGAQLVALVYTDFDSYRATKGLKVTDFDGSDGTNVWFEVTGSCYVGGSTYATHFYENSDIRYKRVLRNLSINSNIIANLPLFDFEWIENNAIGTGTSALAVLKILPNIVSGTDKLTLDYGVLGTIAGITACKELVTLKSELLQLKEKVKLLEDKLSKYENA